MSELFGGIEREPVQAELRGLRVLLELLGLLLTVKSFWRRMTMGCLARRAISVYNDYGFYFVSYD